MLEQSSLIRGGQRMASKLTPSSILFEPVRGSTFSDYPFSTTRSPDQQITQWRAILIR